MNVNCLEGLAYPRCGNEDRLDIQALIVCRVHDDGVDKYFEPEWDWNSWTYCPDCRFDGALSEFQAVS